MGVGSSAWGESGKVPGKGGHLLLPPHPPTALPRQCYEHTLVYKKVTRFCLGRHLWTSLTVPQAYARGYQVSPKKNFKKIAYRYMDRIFYVLCYVWLTISDKRRSKKRSAFRRFMVALLTQFLRDWLFTQLSYLKCIKLGSVRSSYLPFKMH